MIDGIHAWRLNVVLFLFLTYFLSTFCCILLIAVSVFTLACFPVFFLC